MFGYFHDKSYVYVILEIASEGSLFKKVVQERTLTEATTAKVYNFIFLFTVTDTAISICSSWLLVYIICRQEK